MNLENTNEKLVKHIKEQLNHRQPSPPPNIFFIRRNEKMLNRYLKDPEQLERIMYESPQEYRNGFKYFNLDPIEKDITSKLLMNKKKK